jgi:hypothetical protein
MRRCILGLIIFLGPNLAWGADNVYSGTWKTTNRKLDGAMTCAVREVGDQKWQGRFYGVWQGVPFDYTVPFTGETSDLQGTATIDGASYVWKGSIAEGTFRGTFGGSRYAGAFDLKEQTAPIAAKPR